jgi:hypothetical protein
MAGSPEFSSSLPARRAPHYSAVSGATLTGYLNNTGNEEGDFTGNEEGDLQLIGGTAWDMAVLQDQSFRPLPATITIKGQSVATRGDFAGFATGDRRRAGPTVYRISLWSC